MTTQCMEWNTFYGISLNIQTKAFVSADVLSYKNHYFYAPFSFDGKSFEDEYVCIDEA